MIPIHYCPTSPVICFQEIHLSKYPKMMATGREKIRAILNITLMITDCPSVTFRSVFIASVGASTRSLNDGVSAVLLRRLFAEGIFLLGALLLRSLLAESSSPCGSSSLRCTLLLD
jgi:hypothetical protein